MEALNIRITASTASSHDDAVDLATEEAAIVGNVYLRAVVRSQDTGDLSIPSVGSVEWLLDDEPLSGSSSIEPWYPIDPLTGEENTEDLSFGCFILFEKPVTIPDDGEIHTVSVRIGGVEEATGTIGIVPEAEVVTPEDKVFQRFRDLGVPEAEARSLTRRWHGELLSYDEGKAALAALAETDLKSLGFEELDAVATVAEEIKSRLAYQQSAGDRLKEAVKFNG